MAENPFPVTSAAWMATVATAPMPPTTADPRTIGVDLPAVRPLVVQEGEEQGQTGGQQRPERR